MDPKEIGVVIATTFQCLLIALTQKGLENVLVALADEIGHVAQGIDAGAIRDALKAAEKHFQATEP